MLNVYPVKCRSSGYFTGAPSDLRPPSSALWPPTPHSEPPIPHSNAPHPARLADRRRKKDAPDPSDPPDRRR